MISPGSRSLVTFLLLLEWASFFVPSLRLDYYAVGVTVLLFYLLPERVAVAVFFLQGLLAVFAPGPALRAGLVALLALTGTRLDRLSYRWSLVAIGMVFLFLVRVQGYPLPLLFMGLFGFGAVVYAVSRQPDIRHLLNRYLAILLAVIPVYTAAYLFSGFRGLLRPVVVIPLDMVQIVCAAVVIQTVERWWDSGS